MAKARIQIVYHKCPRCGKQTAGLNRPIHGSASAHAKFAGLCGKCVTPEEHREILEDQAQGILSEVNKLEKK